MSDTENSGKERYAHVDIHLCKHCGDEFELGDELVCLSDGMVHFDNIYDVEDRVFFHQPCWEEYRDLHTGSSRSASEGESQ